LKKILNFINFFLS